jgi:hypothetical protein
LQLLQAMADVKSSAHAKVPLVVLLINGRAATFGRGNTVLDKVPFHLEWLPRRAAAGRSAAGRSAAVPQCRSAAVPQCRVRCARGERPPRTKTNHLSLSLRL